MPADPSEITRQYAALDAAEGSRRGGGRKRRRNEADDQPADRQAADVQRLADENARLAADLITIRERLADAERRLEEHAAESARTLEQTNAQFADRIAAQDARIADQAARITAQEARIADQTTQITERDIRLAGRDAEIRAMDRILDRLAPAITAAPAGVQPPAAQLRDNQPAERPQTRDILTADSVQYREIGADGTRPATTRWFRDLIAVPRPDNIGHFVKHGGLPDEGHNRYIIPPGVIVEPHIPLLPANQPADRPSTPMDQRPAPVLYGEKVYYHIASSNVKDADKLGLKFEPKAGSIWENVEAFQNDRGLWYCDNPNIDRTDLSHFTQRNPQTGDYLYPGVLPSDHNQVLMSWRDRSSRGR